MNALLDHQRTKNEELIYRTKCVLENQRIQYLNRD